MIIKLFYNTDNNNKNSSNKKKQGSPPPPPPPPPLVIWSIDNIIAAISSLKTSRELICDFSSDSNLVWILCNRVLHLKRRESWGSFYLKKLFFCFVLFCLFAAIAIQSLFRLRPVLLEHTSTQKHADRDHSYNILYFYILISYRSNEKASSLVAIHKFE